MSPTPFPHILLLPHFCSISTYQAYHIPLPYFLPTGRIFQKSQLLAGLSEEAIAFFVEYAELRTVSADTVVIKQGDMGHEFFIAESGGFNFSVLVPVVLSRTICNCRTVQ